MSDAQETFVSHLIELRSRLLRAVASVLVIFLALFHWAPDIYSFVAHPMMAALPNTGHMIATGVATPFLVPFKVTILVAFLIALPYVLWQLWAFIAPGLYQNEKRLVLPVVSSSVILFFVGMAFAYFVVFPVVFRFMVGWTPEGVTMMTDIEQYLSFVLTMFVAFGAAFETPVIVLVLATLGIVSVEQFKKARPYVIVGAFIVAAIFTPPDVFSQFFLAIPLWVLFEFGLLLARILIRRKADVAEEPAGEAETTEITK